LKNISTVFDRVLFIIEKKGLKNVPDLADALGYESPQKIYRLGQAENAKPSYDIIQDFSNLFDDLNLRWFITGEGEPFIKPSSKNMVAEPAEIYKAQSEIEKLKNKIAELEIEKRSLLLALREVGSARTLPDKNNITSKKKPKS
jgi:hypothetical protein